MQIPQEHHLKETLHSLLQKQAVEMSKSGHLWLSTTICPLFKAPTKVESWTSVYFKSVLTDQDF